MVLLEGNIHYHHEVTIKHTLSQRKNVEDGMKLAIIVKKLAFIHGKIDEKHQGAHQQWF